MVDIEDGFQREIKKYRLGWIRTCLHFWKKLPFFFGAKKDPLTGWIGRQIAADSFCRVASGWPFLFKERSPVLQPCVAFCGVILDLGYSSCLKSKSGVVCFWMMILVFWILAKNQGLCGLRCAPLRLQFRACDFGQ